MKIRGMRGFTLIEALVALLVLSIGLLGVAAMQLKALQSSHVAYQRSISTVAAQDAAERLWVALGNQSGECPSSDSDLDSISDWYAVWEVHFTQLTVQPVDYVANGECEYLITIGWQDSRFGSENVSELIYVIKLPGKV